MDLPLRSTRERLILWGCAFFYAGSFHAIQAVLRRLHVSDWADFWGGGATAGTRALLGPAHLAFEKAHGLVPAIWAYPPAFALVFVPLGHVSLLPSYLVNVAIMFALGAVAGGLLADIFSMPRWFGVVAALAWAPVKIAAISGQNTTLALLLIAAAMLAAKHNARIALGVAIGALLYKATIGLPFVVLLLLRREWRSLAVVGLCAGLWYLLSVLATAGEWAWIPHYVQQIRGWYAVDSLRNAHSAVSLPGMLTELGVPSAIAIVSGGALFAAAVPLLLRVNLVSALALTSLLAVAISVHALSYEAAIALPAIFYLMTLLREPARTWLVVAIYLVALASMFTIPGIAWNLQAVVVLGLTAFFLASGGLPSRAPSGPGYSVARL